MIGRGGAMIARSSFRGAASPGGASGGNHY
jgi:hypothetical protein